MHVMQGDTSVYFLYETSNTVEPLYSGHPWGTTLWLFYRGGLCRGVLDFKCPNFTILHEQLKISSILVYTEDLALESCRLTILFI